MEPKLQTEKLPVMKPIKSSPHAKLSKQQRQQVNDMVRETEDIAIEPIPAWLDQQKFEPILERDFPDLKKIKSFRLEPPAGKGENYTTLLLRANFELELNGK